MPEEVWTLSASSYATRSQSGKEIAALLSPFPLFFFLCCSIRNLKGKAQHQEELVEGGAPRKAATADLEAKILFLTS